MKKIVFCITIICLLLSCNEKKVSAQKMDGFEIVDSVWINEPGRPHSLQTDFIWYGKTPSGIIITKKNSEVKVGDTVWIVKGIKRLL